MQKKNKKLIQIDIFYFSFLQTNEVTLYIIQISKFRFPQSIYKKSSVKVGRERIASKSMDEKVSIHQLTQPFQLSLYIDRLVTQK